MKILFDLHTHTVYSDGKSTIEENITAAEKAGIILGSSEHGKGNVFIGISDSDMGKLREKLDRYFIESGNKILRGIEGNLLDLDGGSDLSEYDRLDYYILGFHKGVFPLRSVSFPLWIRALTDKSSASELLTMALIKAIEKDQRIQVISHPGLYLPIDVSLLSQAMAKNGVLFEINAKHPPKLEDIALAKKNGAKFIISSDAHHSTMIGKYDRCIEIAESAGLDSNDVINAQGCEWDDKLRLNRIRQLLHA